MSVQTRGRLVETAKKVFSERGYHNAQISHIIDEAGVARGTFYLYFKSKEEIFNQELRSRIKTVDLSRNPVEQVVENFERNCDPQLSKITEEFFEDVVAFISSSIEKGISMGLLRECDPKLLARAVVRAIKETIVGLLEEGGVDTYRVAKELVDLGARRVWKKQGGESHGGNFSV